LRIETPDVDFNVRHTQLADLQRPGSMAADPKTRYFFWGDEASNGSIGRVDLGGKHRYEKGSTSTGPTVLPFTVFVR